MVGVRLCDKDRERERESSRERCRGRCRSRTFVFVRTFHETVSDRSHGAARLNERHVSALLLLLLLLLRGVRCGGRCDVSLSCNQKHPVLPVILSPTQFCYRCGMSTPGSHGVAGWVVPNANMNVKFNFVDGHSPPACASVGVKRLGGRGCNSRTSWSTMSTSTCEELPLSPLSRLRLEEKVEDGLSAQVRTLSKFAYVYV